MLEKPLLFFSFVLGLIAGSFLNVVVYRLYREFYQEEISDNAGGRGGRSALFVIGGRSFCPQCRVKLRWFELIPVVSFIIQKRKCNSCGGAISWQYPLVELGTAVVFVLIAWRYFQGQIGF